MLGMAKIKFLEVNLQNFVKIAYYCSLRQERVNDVYVGSFSICVVSKGDP